MNSEAAFVGDVVAAEEEQVNVDEYLGRGGHRRRRRSLIPSALSVIEVVVDRENVIEPPGLPSLQHFNAPSPLLPTSEPAAAGSWSEAEALQPCRAFKRLPLALNRLIREKGQDAMLIQHPRLRKSNKMTSLPATSNDCHPTARTSIDGTGIYFHNDDACNLSASEAIRRNFPLLRRDAELEAWCRTQTAQAGVRAAVCLTLLFSTDLFRVSFLDSAGRWVCSTAAFSKALKSCATETLECLELWFPHPSDDKLPSLLQLQLSRGPSVPHDFSITDLQTTGTPYVWRIPRHASAQHRRSTWWASHRQPRSWLLFPAFSDRVENVNLEHEDRGPGLSRRDFVLPDQRQREVAALRKRRGVSRTQNEGRICFRIAALQ
nr:hypothetical protein CFP56_69088 [Quercus suber]